eukprot:SAG22_NODE_16817_length_317_cov_0.706422_1_plen_54_part_10
MRKVCLSLSFPHFSADTHALANSFKSETGDVNALTRERLLMANVAAMGLADKNA